MKPSRDNGSTDHGAAAAPGIGERVGSFRFYTDGHRWEWSDAVARMHGYDAGTVIPTTELVMSHKHPDDAPSVAVVIDNVLHHQQPFSTRHRIIDTAGRTHVVVVVGDLLHEGHGDGDTVLGTAGFYVDITDSFEADLHATVDDQVSDFAAHRAIIEQAKGILMVTYGVSAQRAFDVLTWRSQETNTKLRDLATRFVETVIHAVEAPTRLRTEVDHLLLTAHEVSTPAAPRKSPAPATRSEQG